MIEDVYKRQMNEVKIPVSVAKHPEDAAVRGILELCKDEEKLKRALIQR